jgi:hypothetical protein
MVHYFVEVAGVKVGAFRPYHVHSIGGARGGVGTESAPVEGKIVETMPTPLSSLQFILSLAPIVPISANG